MKNNDGMKSPYYAGRILVNSSMIMNYKQIISNIVYNAKAVNSDYILFNSDIKSASMIINALLKANIPIEYVSVENETLISIPLNDAVFLILKNNGF